MNPLVIARVIARGLPLAKQVYEFGELVYCRIQARRARKRAALARLAKARRKPIPPPPPPSKARP